MALGHCGSNKSDHSLQIIRLFAGLLLIFGVLQADNAAAGVYFSRQYSMPCSRCHTKIPLLSEVGQEFKDNGYSLEKRAPKPKETLPISEAGPAEPIVPAVAGSKEGAAEKSEVQPALKTPSSPSEQAPPPSKPPPPPPKAEYLYRLQSKDGSYVYTDNPLHADKGLSSEGTLSNAFTSTKESKGTVQAVKPDLSRVSKKKHHKKPADSKVTAEMKKSDGLDSAEVKKPSIMAKTQPFNFEKCMERILFKSDQPNSSAEAMEQFVKAESSCNRYAPPR